MLTPDGKVAIQDLREGDLVVARHELTGEKGEFPVTALMARQALGVIWLTLDDGATRLGVTDEHPMFVVGKGWTEADKIGVGEAIRDAGLRDLNVTAVDVDNVPRRVHNLEIAGAATYFVGELEAWGHNRVAGYGRKKGGGGKKQWYDKKSGRYVCPTDVKMAAKMDLGDFAGGVDKGNKGVFVNPRKESVATTCGNAMGWFIRLFLRNHG